MAWYVDPAVLRARYGKPALAVEHSVTSRSAAAKIEPYRMPLRERVFAVIEAGGAYGTTDEEGIEATGMSPSTYRPRRVELVEAGRIRDSHRTRKTRSGREAVVWVCSTEQGCG